MRSAKPVAVFLAVLAAANVAAFLGGADLPIVEPDEGPRKRFASQLRREKPEIVLVGNSLLAEGVDPERLGARLGRRVTALAQPGTQTAFWYLTLKNVVLRAKHRPRLVVLFFVDTFLTEPTQWVQGKYRAKIAGMYRGKEPLVERLAYRTGLAADIMEAVPLFHLRYRARDGLDRAIKRSLVASFLDVDAAAPDKAIELLFADARMDRAQLSARQIRAASTPDMGVYDFERRLADSLLPHMVALVEKKGVDLALVRLKRRRDVVPGREPAALLEYVAALGDYCRAKGVFFTDFTYEARIQESHFGNGDHMDDGPGQALLTDLLAVRMKPLLTRERAARITRK